MIDEIDADTLFSELVMLRDVDGRLVLLLEGPDDEDALGAHVDGECVLIVLTHGGSNMDQLVEIVDDQGLNRVVALRDRDWLGILHPLPESPNIVLTDLYDLDITILVKTTVLPRVVNAYADTARVAAHLEAAALKSPEDLLVKVAVEVGVLRLISVESGLDLSLRDFPVHQVMTNTAPYVDRGQLLTIAISKSLANPDPDALHVDIGERLTSLDEHHRYCSGHDAIEALAHLVRQEWGSYSHPTRSLAAAIRAALACDDLRSLDLYKQLSNWCNERGERLWSCEPA